MSEDIPRFEMSSWLGDTQPQVWPSGFQREYPADGYMNPNNWCIAMGRHYDVTLLFKNFLTLSDYPSAFRGHLTMGRSFPSLRLERGS